MSNEQGIRNTCVPIVHAHICATLVSRSNILTMALSQSVNKDYCIYYIGELIQICRGLGVGCTNVQPSKECASELMKQFGWIWQADDEEEEDTGDLLEELEKSGR